MAYPAVHKVVTNAFMVSKAIKSDGTREVIGFNVYDTEDNYSWSNFLKSLKSRGLDTVQMFTSDSHKSIRPENYGDCHDGIQRNSQYEESALFGVKNRVYQARRFGVSDSDRTLSGQLAGGINYPTVILQGLEFTHKFGLTRLNK